MLAHSATQAHIRHHLAVRLATDAIQGGSLGQRDIPHANHAPLANTRMKADNSNARLVEIFSLGQQQQGTAQHPANMIADAMKGTSTRVGTILRLKLHLAYRVLKAWHVLGKRHCYAHRGLSPQLAAAAPMIMAWLASICRIQTPVVQLVWSA